MTDRKLVGFTALDSDLYFVTQPFCSRPFFIPHWSASTDLSVITRAFCFWFLMDCASTHECTASNTSKCLTRQIFTESIIKWENGYPATPEGLRYHSLCTRTFDSNRSELCIREWHDAFAPQVKGPQKFLTKSEIAASRRRSTGPNEVLQKYCNSYYFIFNWICCIVERKYVFNLLKSEKKHYLLPILVIKKKKIVYVWNST